MYQCEWISIGRDSARVGRDTDDTSTQRTQADGRTDGGTGEGDNASVMNGAPAVRLPDRLPQRATA